MPPLCRKVAWFSSCPQHNRLKMHTASARKEAGAPTSLKRLSMMRTASSCPSSSCKPGSPTKLRRSIKAPCTKPRLEESSDSEHASKKRNVTMCPASTLNLSGALGARFRSTDMDCSCKTRSCVRGRRLITCGVTCGACCCCCCGEDRGLPLFSNPPPPSPSSHAPQPPLPPPLPEDEEERWAKAATVANAVSGLRFKSTFRYMRSTPNKLELTTSRRLTGSVRLKSDKSAHKMRFSSKSAACTVAKLCKSTCS
mmetsp:Transcript_31471/g.57350  ORF Transcript_31471/g.57350 Transcript_31471/m.57350 type:complete len:254 (-) Transcript_31471:1010-1771(-)